MNCDRKTVFKWLKELEGFRLIERIHRDKRGQRTSNQYLLNDEHFAKFLSRTVTLVAVEKTGHGAVEKTGQELEPINKAHTPSGQEQPAVIPFPKGHH